MPNERKVLFSIWLKSFTRLEVILIVVLLLSVIATIIQLYSLVARSKRLQQTRISHEYVQYSDQLIESTHNMDIRKWQQNGTFLEKNEYGFLAALSEGNNISKVACALSIVSSEWLITSAGCVQNINNLDDHRIVEEDVDAMTSPSKIHKIAGVMYHPNYIYGVIDNDIALLKSENELAAAKECFVYAISPRLKARLVYKDMMILLTWKSNRNGDRLRPFAAPIFLLKNFDETRVEHDADGSPVVRGRAVYALVSFDGRLTCITNHIEWIRDNVLHENESVYA